jgi:hypothetical protein
MPTEKPKKAPLKTASGESKTDSSKSAPKSLKASTRKAKSVEKDWLETAVPEKSSLKKAAAKKSVSKVNLSAPKAEAALNAKAAPKAKAALKPKAAPRAEAVPRAKAAPKVEAARGAEAAPNEEAGSAQSDAQKTSVVLKALLENNSSEWFTVEQICEGLGTSSFGVSLLAFSIPEVVPIPVPGISAIVALPTAVVSAQMIAGKKELRLPAWLLKRKVPRKALAAAIHAVLPVLKRIEKGAKPRGTWVSNPLTQRLLGLFIFVLALFIALPIPATNMPPAIAIFVTSLGMVERDGVLICVGVLIGLASMVLIGALALGSFSLLSGLFNF